MRLSQTYDTANRLRGGRKMKPHQPCFSPPSGPEPTSYQFKRSFDPSRSLNPYVKSSQNHHDNSLYFSYRTPDQDATDCAHVNIGSAHPACSTTKASIFTNTAQSSHFPPVSRKLQQLGTVITDDESSLPCKYMKEASDSWIPIL